MRRVDNLVDGASTTSYLATARPAQVNVTAASVRQQKLLVREAITASVGTPEFASVCRIEAVSGCMIKRRTRPHHSNSVVLAKVIRSPVREA